MRTRQQAREWCRQQIAFYGTTPNYRPVFESNGEGHLTDQLRETFKADPRDVAALRAAVPEDAVDRYAVAGTPDEVRRQAGGLAPLADHWVVSSPWYHMASADMEANFTATLQALGGLRSGSA